MFARQGPPETDPELPVASANITVSWGKLIDYDYLPPHQHWCNMAGNWEQRQLPGHYLMLLVSACVQCYGVTLMQDLRSGRYQLGKMGKKGSRGNLAWLSLSPGASSVTNAYTINNVKWKRSRQWDWQIRFGLKESIASFAKWEILCITGHTCCLISLAFLLCIFSFFHMWISNKVSVGISVNVKCSVPVLSLFVCIQICLKD